MVNPKKGITFAPAYPTEAYSRDYKGEMVEWSITPVLKTGVLRGTGGSNPSLSAKIISLRIKVLTIKELGLFSYPDGMNISRMTIKK